MGQLRRVPREQIFIPIFFMLWALTAIGSHVLGNDLLRAGREYRVAADEEAPPELMERLASRGTGLMVFNLPLFVGIGPMMRAETPAPTPLYWVLVVLGSAYVPFFATICIFFLVHPPSQPGTYPGVEWEDEEEIGEEDPDDDTKRR
jgi:hypothetical protein